MSKIRNVTVVAGVVALLATHPAAALAVTNVWNAGTSWADFGTLSNWSVGKKLADGGTAATALPGEDDFISCDPTLEGSSYVLGRFDLGGSAWTIKGWSLSSTAWKTQLVSLTNGTLTVKEPNDKAAGAATTAGRWFTVENGAKLVYPAGNTTSDTGLASSGLSETWTVQGGGEVEIYSAISVAGKEKTFATSTILAGGKLVFRPSSFGVSSWNDVGYSIDNYGALDLANGLDWTGKAATGSKGGVDEDRLRVRQLGGKTILGGDFVKTAKSNYCPGRMTFVLGGGTLEVTGDAKFYTADSAKDETKGFGEQVYAEMPDAATAMVDVAGGATIDMTPFTYGANAALTKVGAGAMTLAALPASLTVNAGSVTFSQALAGEGSVTFAEGAKAVLAAKENDLTGVANATVADWTLGEGFAVGDVVATGADAATLEAVAAKLALPSALSDAGVKARVRDGAIVLYLATTVEIKVRDLTLYAGDEAANAGYVVVNKKTGEVIENAALAGTPTFVCDYAAGSETGTYDITVSGLSSEDLTIETITAGKVTVVPADERKTFYWKGGTAFADFGDVANWATDADGTAATRLPGRNDFIANVGSESEATAVYGTKYRLAKWDLLGGAQRFYGYVPVDTTKKWQNWWIDLTNGTLTVGNPTANANKITGGSQGAFGHLYNVWNGATLVYPADSYDNGALAGSGLMERWEIHAGGTVWALGGLMFVSTTKYKGGALVEDGGTLYLSPEALSVGSNNPSGIEIVNRGEMICPEGLVWTGTGYNSSTTAESGRDELLVVQESGRMLLGGDVMRTNNIAKTTTLASRLELILKGGVLEVTNSVRVATSANSAEGRGDEYLKQAFASFDDGADVVIDLKPGAFLDLTEFTYGTDVKVTTKGTGRVLFGEAMPSSLVFVGGALEYATPAADAAACPVSFGDGASGTFALRAWKNADGAICCDALDLSAGVPEGVVIKPSPCGFRFKRGETIRLGDYSADLALPSAERAAKGWVFCRTEGDATGLYLCRDRGFVMTIR